MRINHNISALNTYRQMGANQTAASKNMEKLSSGLAINRAGDNAAGLAISEKMRAQVRGLDQASTNAQDGISLIQTAEGALNETHSILQRMRELAVQAGNDTNTESDRGEIQKEINSLTSEINRIGNTTEFNTQKLLNGTKEGEGAKVVTAGKDAVTAANGTTTAIAGATFTVTNSDALNGYKIVYGKVDETATGSITANVDKDAKTITINGKFNGASSNDSASDVATAISNSLTTAGISGVTVSGAGTIVSASTGASGTITGGRTAVAAVRGTYEFTPSNQDITIDGETIAYNSKSTTTADFKDADSLLAAIKVNVTLNNKYDAAVVDGKIQLTQKAGATAGAVVTGNDNTVSLQIGANENQSMSIDVSDMRAKALGITGNSGDAGFTADNAVNDGTNSTAIEAGLSVATAKDAAAAVTKIQSAIDTVSSERSKLGAFQNRLEHTINNLGTSSENLTAAESRIRDVDMAKEMMDMTKNNILQQAAQAMLAQANQQPQGVLQLLR